MKSGLRKNMPNVKAEHKILVTGCRYEDDLMEECWGVGVRNELYL